MRDLRTEGEGCATPVQGRLVRSSRAWWLCAVLVLALAAGRGAAAERDAAARSSPFSSAARTPTLPPLHAWSGKSRALAARPGDAWITPCEQSGLTRTPRYDETIAWLQRLCAATPELEMQSLGKSLEGRDIWMVVATHAGAFTPAALHAAGKPIPNERSTVAPAYPSEFNAASNGGT